MMTASDERSMRRWLREGSDEEEEYQSDVVFQEVQWNTEGVLMKTGQVQVVIHQLLACCQQMEILTGLIRGADRDESVLCKSGPTACPCACKQF